MLKNKLKMFYLGKNKNDNDNETEMSKNLLHLF